MDEDHLFYIKAVPSRQWSGNREKAAYSVSQIPAKKFEVVGIYEYDPEKHENITIERLLNKFTRQTLQSCEIIDFTISSPSAKRALFHDDAAATAKKKVYLKIE